MPVVFAVPRGVIGGAERLLVEVAGGLASDVGTTVVLGEDGPLVDRLRDAELEPKIGFEHLSSVVPGATVVVGWSDHGHLAGGPVAASHGVPAVWWRTLTWRGRHYEHEAATVPAACVVVPTHRAAARQRDATPDHRIEVIAPGVRVDEIRSRRGGGQQVRRDLGWEDEVVVGMVARLDPIKGQDLLLRAVASTPALGTVHVLVVGSDILGYERDVASELQALVEDLGLGDRVRFVPQVDDPVPWHDALDVEVCGSEHEAFGLSLVEAMALGVPVVATATDGPSEILRDGRDGMVVDVGDVDALARCLDQLANEASVRLEMGERAAARARDFDLSVTCDRTKALLTSLVGS